MVCSTLQKRSRIAYSTIPPMIGILSDIRCQISLPLGCIVRKAMIAKNSREQIAVMYQRSVKKRATNSIIRVGSGRSALSSSNSGLNCGST